MPQRLQRTAAFVAAMRLTASVNFVAAYAKTNARSLPLWAQGRHLTVFVG